MFSKFDPSNASWPIVLQNKSEKQQNHRSSLNLPQSLAQSYPQPLAQSLVQSSPQSLEQSSPQSLESHSKG